MHQNRSNYVLLAIFLLRAASGEESGHHHQKITEQIPVADENLLRPEVSEDVEFRLANVEIGRNIVGRQRRGPVSNLPPAQFQDTGNAENEVEEFHERTIIKSQDHGESQRNQAETLGEDGHESHLGPEHTEKLLRELNGLRKNIEKEIIRLQRHQSDQKAQNRANILVRASRELVQRAELDSRRKRNDNSVEAEILMPYRACIYIDIPGAHNKDEGVPLLPETLQLTPQQNPFEAQNQDKTVESMIEGHESSPDSGVVETEEKSSLNFMETENKSSSNEMEMREKSIPSSQSVNIQNQQHPPPTESDDAAVEDVLWLHMPANDPLEEGDMRTKLYNTVDHLHHEGKDVLFIPISKNYSDTEDVKHGFLKSLHIKPERFRNYRSVRVKRL